MTKLSIIHDKFAYFDIFVKFLQSWGETVCPFTIVGSVTTYDISVTVHMAFSEKIFPIFSNVSIINWALKSWSVNYVSRREWQFLVSFVKFDELENKSFFYFLKLYHLFRTFLLFIILVTPVAHQDSRRNKQIPDFMREISQHWVNQLNKLHPMGYILWASILFPQEQNPSFKTAPICVWQAPPLPTCSVLLVTLNGLSMFRHIGLELIFSVIQIFSR